MNVVRVRRLPPFGPVFDPITCSKRHGIAPVFGQLASEPAATDAPANAFAQITLLSSELCHVGLPAGSGLGAFTLGLLAGLRKCVTIWLPSSANSVASGRLGF